MPQLLSSTLTPPFPIPHCAILLTSILTLALLTACNDQPESDNGEVTGYINATIWDGVSQAPIGNAGLVVRNGIIEELVPMADWTLPEETETVDLAGLYVIPGLINAHGHVGMARGLETGPEVHSEGNVIDQLGVYARYGITSVVSLGDEPPQAADVRDRLNPAEEGIARLWLAGRVLNPESPEEAVQQVDQLIEVFNPDWSKIRVDDQLGQTEKMSPPVYGATIDASHQHGVPLAAHIVTLEDAKGVLEEGAGLIAHSVRDQPVDDEFIDEMLNLDICITPTLTREVSVFIYADRPDFFDDPFFLREADQQVIGQLQDPDVQAQYTGEAADFYREALPLALENMMTLHQAGVRIAMGTDSGPPGRFQGYFEHIEMEMMQEAGMTPGEVLLSATQHAANCSGIDDRVGTLEAGKQADFVVVRANPFDDVENLRELEAVYIGGVAVGMD